MCKFWKKEKCNHHFPELNKRRRLALWCEKYLTLNRVIAILLVVIGGLSFLCINEINASATSGYRIRELENRLNALKEENKKLNLTYIELQSMASLTGKVQEMNLVAIDHAEVVEANNSQVALVK